MVYKSTTKELIANYVNQDRVKINVINVQQQENNSDCGVFAIAYAQCLLEGNNPTEYDFIHPRKHLANYLPTGSLPKFPKVLTDVVLHKEVHIPLKPVSLIMKKIYFVCVVNTIYCIVLVFNLVLV